MSTVKDCTELHNVKRLSNLGSEINLTTLDQETLQAILLIDGTNNYEYFSHKYNVSNELKGNLELMAKNFEDLRKNKRFLFKDLKKNIYFFGKKHLKTLNTLNFLDNKNVKPKDYLNILDNINKIDVPKFTYDGNYLKAAGMKEGALIGKTLRLIENEWLNNDFNISNKRVIEIIKAQNS